MIDEDRLSSFRKAGFEVIPQDRDAKFLKPVKLVKGRCEIRLSDGADGLQMEIPVVRIRGQERKGGQAELP